MRKIRIRSWDNIGGCWYEEHELEITEPNPDAEDIEDAYSRQVMHIEPNHEEGIGWEIIGGEFDPSTGIGAVVLTEGRSTRAILCMTGWTD